MQKLREPAGGILIVEDHPAMTRLLVSLLSGAFPAHGLRIAGGAEEALALCATELPTLAVIDIALPCTNGIEAARRIKALAPSVRVIMHSGHDQPIYREQSIAAGADAFVSKSQTYTELVPAISRLIAPAGIDQCLPTSQSPQEPS